MITIVITALISIILTPASLITVKETSLYSETTAMVFSGTNAIEQSAAAPEISFDKTEYDFGKVTFKGKPKSVKFRFKNTGDAPLVITRTELSCTCLSLEYPRKPVMPGEDGFLTVTYSPKKETGKFNNTVKIFSNSAERNPEILFLRVEVTK